MIQIASAARSVAAFTFRRLPNIRGRGRLVASWNKILPSDPDPRVWADMRLGYRMLVDLRSGTEVSAYYTGDYDTPEIEGALRLVHRGSIILDIGANVGFWTIPLGKAAGDSGRVHAFEPVPSNFTRLSTNVVRNGLASTVSLHEFGLSDDEAELQMSLRDDFQSGAETGNASIVIDESDLKFHCTQISVRPLDKVVDAFGVGKIDFIKVDIEGHEDKFLVGAERTISQFRPVLYMEVNELYFTRRGLDVNEVLEPWMGRMRYVSVLPSHGTWALRPLRERHREVSDVFFLPAESAESLLRQLAR